MDDMKAIGGIVTAVGSAGTGAIQVATITSSEFRPDLKNLKTHF